MFTSILGNGGKNHQETVKSVTHERVFVLPKLDSIKNNFGVHQIFLIFSTYKNWNEIISKRIWSFCFDIFSDSNPIFIEKL